MITGLVGRCGYLPTSKSGRKTGTNLLLCGMVLIISACGNGAQADEPVEHFQIRSPRATFTPTPPNEVSAPIEQSPATDSDGNLAQTEADAASDPNPTSTVESVPETRRDTARSFQGYLATINTALVNGRSGPGTNYEVIGIVEDGQSFDVVGQNDAGDWWRICCYNDEEFWVINDYVEISQGANGPIIPAATPIPAAPPTSVPIVQAEEPVPASSDQFAFDLVVQEQFPETSIVRIFLYVFSEQIQALPGYSLQVTKDGNQLPVDSLSFGPQAGFTWPIATARQRFQNMKVEFPGESPGGQWTVQLINDSGQMVGPPATFELNNNEQNRELYVRYQQR